MAEETKYGTPWDDDDLDAIVADYFVMLADDLARRPYVKSKHSAALMKKIDRSHRSVEFKHQNISAVLEALGMPWIPGYVPKNNYQNAIFDAIDRYLTHHPASLEIPIVFQSTNALPATFVPAPTRAERDQPPRLQRLVRKFDPVQRDHKNRALGRAGEAFVFEMERQRLTSLAGTALAQKVRWVADEDGDGAGYDIYSYNADGSDRLIEVKTTNGAAQTPFFLTRNERDLATERPDNWLIYRVHLFAKQPQVFTLLPPLENVVNLRAETWRASF